MTRSPASNPPRPLIVGLILTLLAIGTLVWAMARLTIDRTPDAAAGSADLARLWPVWIASGAAWVGLTITAVGIGPRRVASARFWRAGLVVLAVAAAARIAIVATHDPALSDDIYRYVFDGRNLAHGVNPYLVAPEERAAPALPTPLALIPAPGDYAERWSGESAVVRLVNNPELHTIYLPTSQLVFAAAGALVPAGNDDPDTAARVFRSIFVAIELALMSVLLVALRLCDRSAWWLALYAWHPLPLIEVAGEGHQDIVGVALLVVALTLYTASPKKLIAPIVSVALAVLVKPVALPVAALVLKGRSWTTWLVAAVVGLAVTTTLALPLLLAHGGEPVANLRETAQRFTLKWAHFGGVYESLLASIERLTPDWTNDPQEQLARKICAGLLGLVIIGVWLRGRDAWRDAGLIFLAMVLLTPTAHPWYLLWALALTPIAMSRAVWVASLTLPWGYAVLADPVEWLVPTWVMVAAYAPVYLVLVADIVAAWSKHDPRKP